MMNVRRLLLSLMILLSSLCQCEQRSTELARCNAELRKDAFPPGTCALVMSNLSSTENLAGINPDGSFFVVNSAKAGNASEKRFLPVGVRSEIALTYMTVGIPFTDAEGKGIWSGLRDLFCFYNPDRSYFNLEYAEEKCGTHPVSPNIVTALEYMLDVVVPYVNKHPDLFREGRSKEVYASAKAAEDSRSPKGSFAALSNNDSSHGSPRSESHCAKSISFAVATGSGVVEGFPAFARKWVEKNKAKHPNLCFSQEPTVGAANYLIVFSSSQSALYGFFPTVRNRTSSNTTPVSGSGTVTDYYGGFWSYTYTGTVTTTTTTSERIDLPYADTTDTIYAYAFDERGVLGFVGHKSRTARQGGDAANTFGYNLGSFLTTVHYQERLLKDAVKAIEH